MTSNLTFASVTEERLRQILDADYRELQVCISNQAWKAAIVLSGSIAEAVLTDYLLCESSLPSDPLKMMVAERIQTSLQLGGIDQRTTDFSPSLGVTAT